MFFVSSDEIVVIDRPPAGITSNDRKKPLTRMRYALVVNSSVVARSW